MLSLAFVANYSQSPTSLILFKCYVQFTMFCFVVQCLKSSVHFLSLINLNKMIFIFLSIVLVIENKLDPLEERLQGRLNCR